MLVAAVTINGCSGAAPAGPPPSASDITAASDARSVSNPRVPNLRCRFFTWNLLPSLTKRPAPFRGHGSTTDAPGLTHPTSIVPQAEISDEVRAARLSHRRSGRPTGRRISFYKSAG